MLENVRVRFGASHKDDDPFATRITIHATNTTTRQTHHCTRRDHRNYTAIIVTNVIIITISRMHVLVYFTF